MDKLNNIWALNAQQIVKNNHQKNVIILIMAEDEALCSALIQYYIQVNQIRLYIQFRPLPLDKYKRHYITSNGLTNAVKKLSLTEPVILFFPDDESAPYADKERYLTKTTSDPFDTSLIALNTPLPTAVTEILVPQLWGDLPYCYAIIHAVKSFWLPSDFQDDDIEHACLYEGNAAEDYESSAPYLIKLSLDNAFTNQLFSQNPDNTEDGFNYWGRNIGILFKSQGSFSDVLKHFRQFIYMPTYDDRLLYFRFFDPPVLCQYLDIINEHPKKLATFFGGDLIELFVANVGEKLIDYVPTINLSNIDKAPKQFEKFEMQIFIDQQDESLLQTVVDDLIKDFPNHLNKDSSQEVYAVVKESFTLAKKYNMSLTGSIYLLASYQLILGGSINALANTKSITDKFKSDDPEHVKIGYLKKSVLQHADNKQSNTIHHGVRK